MPQDGPVLYDRTFGFHPLVSALVLGVLSVSTGLIVYSAPAAARTDVAALAVALAGLPALLIVALVWRMRVLVTDAELRITWGLLQLIRFRFALTQLRSYRAVKFSPIVDFGGWGVRRGRRGVGCYNTRGNRGVLLEFGARRVIVGVDAPERLLEALELATALRPQPALESLGQLQGP